MLTRVKPALFSFNPFQGCYRIWPFFSLSSSHACIKRSLPSYSKDIGFTHLAFHGCFSTHFKHIKQGSTSFELCFELNINTPVCIFSSCLLLLSSAGNDQLLLCCRQVIKHNKVVFISLLFSNQFFLQKMFVQL